MTNRFTRRTALAGGAALLAAPALLPRRALAQDGTIRLGFVSPRTGPVAAFGAPDEFVLRGIRAAVEGGIEIGGRSYAVEIIEKDSQSNPNRAAEAASELILDDEVHLMLAASTADTTIPVSDQCELNEVPCLTTDTPWDGWFFGRGGDPARGFDWTHHFFWGARQLVSSYTSLWDQIDTNRRVGMLWSNDSDGVPLSNEETGLPPLFRAAGYELTDAGFHQPLSDDFTAQISRLREAGCEIVSGVFLPPDFTTFWTQCAQQGYRPKIATVAKALLFPSSAEALGDLGDGVSSEVWWSPDHPFASGLTGTTSAELAAGYTEATGQQWIQPLGFKHALFEVAIDALRRCGDPADPGAVVSAIAATDYASIVGPVNFSGGPVPGVSTTPLVGGQWVQGGADWPFDLEICENAGAPMIPVTAPFRAL